MVKKIHTANMSLITKKKKKKEDWKYLKSIPNYDTSFIALEFFLASPLIFQ